MHAYYSANMGSEQGDTTFSSKIILNKLTFMCEIGLPLSFVSKQLESIHFQVMLHQPNVTKLMIGYQELEMFALQEPNYAEQIIIIVIKQPLLRNILTKNNKCCRGKHI